MRIALYPKRWASSIRYHSGVSASSLSADELTLPSANRVSIYDRSRLIFVSFFVLSLFFFVLFSAAEQALFSLISLVSLIGRYSPPYQKAHPARHLYLGRAYAYSPSSSHPAVWALHLQPSPILHWIALLYLLFILVLYIRTLSFVSEGLLGGGVGSLNSSLVAYRSRSPSLRTKARFAYLR